MSPIERPERQSASGRRGRHTTWPDQNRALFYVSWGKFGARLSHEAIFPPNTRPGFGNPPAGAAPCAWKTRPRQGNITKNNDFSGDALDTQYTTITYAVNDGILTLTLNRPEQLNALQP